MTDETRPYVSPTTPGLAVTFRDYVIELVCLNLRKPLKPRFWKDDPYWAKKYARECRGFKKFSTLHEDRLDDPVYQRAIIAAVRWVQPGTLLNETLLTRLDRRIALEHKKLLAQREQLARNEQHAEIDPQQYMQRNARIVDLGGGGKMRRLKEIEAHGQNQREEQGAGVVR